MPKIHTPQRLSQNANLPVPLVPNIADALELYPSSDEISDAEAEDPQIPGIYPLQVGDIVSRTAPSLNCAFQV